MRTVSAKDAKGQEPRRRFRDDVRLLFYIIRIGLHYLTAGHSIRRKFYARQAAGEKLFLDQ